MAFLSVGGSSFNWYAGLNEDRDPYGVIKNYHTATATIDALLQGMYDNGQRRLRFIIYHSNTDFGSGTLMASAGGDLPAQCKTNLANILAKMLAIGFEEVIIAFGPQGFNVPVDCNASTPPPYCWSSFQVAYYNENWSVIQNVRAIVVASGLPYLIDVWAEGIPVSGNPIQMQYVQTLWAAYVGAYGTSDTLGFSCVPDSRFVPQIPTVYAGTYPPVFAFHFYDNASANFLYVFGALAGMGLGAIHWIIAEAYYNDAAEAAAIMAAIASTGQTVNYVVQWVNINGGDPFITPPLDYWRYLLIVCGIAQNLTPPGATAPTSTINVTIGATTGDTVANLADAINANPTAAGSTFSAYGAPNPVATASASGTTLSILGIPGQNSNGTPVDAGGSILGIFGTPAGGEGGGIAPQSVAESTNPTAESYQWNYQAGGTTINLASGQTPPAAGETIWVEYKPVGFGVVTVDSPAEIVSRAAAEGGSGIYENLASRPDLLTLDDGAAAAQALLLNNSSMARTVQFGTDTPGLVPGMIVVIDDDALGVAGSFSIQSITGTVIRKDDGDHFRYTVTAVSSNQPITSVAMLAALVNTGSPTGLATSGTSSAPKPPAVALDSSNTAATGLIELNFGVDDDTVGENVAGKYAPIKNDGVCFEGFVTVNRLAPYGSDDTIFDILVSSDKGESWVSIFPPGITALGGGIVIQAEQPTVGAQDINFDANPRVRLISSFANGALKKGWLARLDCLQGGGATDIEIYIHGQPSGKSGAGLLFSGSGGSGAITLL